MARKDKNIAMRLRMLGKTYGEIQKEMGGIPKSTLSSWLSNLVISDEARSKILDRTRERSFAGLLKRNKKQTLFATKRSQEIRSVAKCQIQALTKEGLWLSGIALYWAEGYKRPKMKNGRELNNHPVSLTNADPELLKIFLRFLVEVCNVDREKIKVGVRIFQHLNEETVLNYWSEQLKISRNNFTKTYLGVSRSSAGKRPFNRLPYGVVQIRINSTDLFHKIMGWIEGLKGQASMPR